MVVYHGTLNKKMAVRRAAMGSEWKSVASYFIHG